jgi:Uma2 family endonuclease
LFRDRIRLIIGQMEHAIAEHEFEEARFYSNEERKLRQVLGELGKQYELDDKPPVTPFLCIDVISPGDTLLLLQQRIQEFFDADVVHVWLIDPSGRRAYTATREEGLRECKGGLLPAQERANVAQEIFE